MEGICLPAKGLLRVSDKVFLWNLADQLCVNIKSVSAATLLIRIHRTWSYNVHDTIDLVMSGCFRPNSPVAVEDMQTDYDAVRPEERSRNRIASVDEYKEDQEVE